MNTTQLLHQRISSPMLDGVAPSQDQLEYMLKAALRAPDHGGLRPYRFLSIEGADLKALGELFVKATLHEDSSVDEEKANKVRKMPLRAPMVLVAIAVTQEHPKVPESEQLITAGCAAQAVVQAAFAQGLGAMWRTGALAYNTVVKAGLGLQSHEHIVGFIYLGQAASNKAVPEHDVDNIIEPWGLSND